MTCFLRHGRGASSDSAKLDCKNTIQNAIKCIDRQIVLAAMMDVYLPTMQWANFPDIQLQPHVGVELDTNRLYAFWGNVPDQR